MKKINFLYLILFIFIHAACAPYGDVSRLRRLTDSSDGPSLFGGKTKSQLSPGSTSNQVTSANYKVSLNIGSQYTQSSTITSGNYKVFTSFNQKIAK